MTEFFRTVLYTPIYNLLIGLTDVLPGYDIGLAVVAATVIIKLLILPLSLSALRTTRAVKVLEPELKRVREQYKEDREAQARAMMALYKEHKVNPFAAILTVLIQFPILITLYWVFSSSTLLTVRTELLYPFVPAPEFIAPLFLGLFAVTGASITLALLAGVTQLVYGWYAMPVPEKPKEPGKDMAADMGHMMALQMRYLLPIVITAGAYFTSVAVSLYFITSNVVGIAQEFYVRKTKTKETAS